MSKLCKDCHYAYVRIAQYVCTHPAVVTAHDPVAGADEVLCGAERAHKTEHGEHPCGNEGTFWTPRRKPTITDHGHQMPPPIPDDDGAARDWMDRARKRGFPSAKEESNEGHAPPEERPETKI